MAIKIEAANRLAVTAGENQLAKIEAKKPAVVALVKKMLADKAGMKKAKEPGVWIADAVAKLCGINEEIYVDDTDWKTKITFCDSADRYVNIKL